jgi:hypothetical protein
MTEGSDCFTPTEIALVCGTPLFPVATVAAVTLHAAEDVVQCGAGDGEEHGAASRDQLYRLELGVGERQPGDEGTDPGDEKHDEKGQGRPAALATKFHWRTLSFDGILGVAALSGSMRIRNAFRLFFHSMLLSLGE